MKTAFSCGVVVAITASDRAPRTGYRTGRSSGYSAKFCVPSSRPNVQTQGADPKSSRFGEGGIAYRWLYDVFTAR